MVDLHQILTSKKDIRLCAVKVWVKNIKCQLSDFEKESNADKIFC